MGQGRRLFIVDSTNKYVDDLLHMPILRKCIYFFAAFFQQDPSKVPVSFAHISQDGDEDRGDNFNLPRYDRVEGSSIVERTRCWSTNERSKIQTSRVPEIAHSTNSFHYSWLIDPIYD